MITAVQRVERARVFVDDSSSKIVDEFVDESHRYVLTYAVRSDV